MTDKLTSPPFLVAGHSSNAERRAILAAGLIAGIIDILFVSLLWWPYGVAPLAILQTVASGLLGPAAFAGGAGTGLLGLLLHLTMTVAMAAIYLRFAPRRWRRHPWIAGPLSGAAIWVVMNLVVVPLSAAPIGLPPILVGAADFAGHLVLIGLPIALVTARRDRPRGRNAGI